MDIHGRLGIKFITRDKLHKNYNKRVMLNAYTDVYFLLLMELYPLPHFHMPSWHSIKQYLNNQRS